MSQRALAGLATVIAAVATSGSLYFSYGMGLYPCDLCWFQRIFMYPLVIVFAIGALRHRDFFDVGVGLAVPGLLIAAYHSYVQVSAHSCPVGGACGAVQYRLVGLSIPNLSLIAFAALLVVSVVALRRQ